MENYFTKKGTENNVVNAEILLTETEKNNLVIIKTVEAKKKK